MKFFTNKYDYMIFGLAIVILSFTIFFPLASDMAAFMQGGMILRNGGKLYVDFFDVKPPFVYYIYELFYSIFGSNFYLYRAFDVLYQAIFLLSSIYVFSKLKFEKNAIRLFVILLPVAYVTLSYPSTNQVESLFFLPVIWYFYHSSKTQENWQSPLIKGILLGIAINLKYTFGILILADILYGILQGKKLKAIFKDSVIQLLIALLVTIVLFSPVLLNGNFSSFIKFFNYMKEYSSYPSWGASTVLHIIKEATSFFTDNYSIVLFLSAIYTIFYNYIRKGKNQNNSYINGLTIFAIILFLSVVIERKLFPYHEQRVYPFLVMLSSIGLILVASEIKRFRKLTILVIVLVSIIFSPLPRFIKIIRFPFGVITKGAEPFYSELTVAGKGNLIKKQYELANYINRTTNTNKVLLINTAEVEIMFYFNFEYKYSFPQSAFYLNESAPNYLKERAFEDIKDADIIIIQKNDNSAIMFFNEDTSLDALKKNPVMWNYIKNNFEQDTIIENAYIVFKRNINDK